MLSDARMRKQEGIDVVVGYVETHGRAETETLLIGLETIPLVVTEYKGVQLAEMDLDGVLARRPRICLLYTSDAADDLLCVDLGGRRIIKKKKKKINNLN